MVAVHLARVLGRTRYEGSEIGHRRTLPPVKNNEVRPLVRH